MNRGPEGSEVGGSSGDEVNWSLTNCISLKLLLHDNINNYG